MAGEAVERRPSTGWRGGGGISGRRLAGAAHQADGVELGLLARILLGALAHLVALVEQLDLLELLERLAERRLGVVELTLSSSAERLRFSRRCIAALA